MSTLRVTAEPLTIHEHPNADALELAQVGLYRAVVAKGAYRSGDFAVYIPEQAVLPAGLIDELGLTGRLAGRASDRVKAVRLRGELSQGIVCRPRALADVDLARAAADGENFAERLSITKWSPPIPPTMGGDVERAPDLLPWVDIENIQRYPEIFEPGEVVVLTEKLHGTACLMTYCVADGGTVQVSSKGFGSKGLALTHDPRNLYWRAVLGHDVPAVAARLAEKLGASRIGFFGEVYGAGVQDLAYGANARAEDTLGYAVFDVSAEIDGQVHWMDAAELLEGQLPLVPRLYEGPYDIGTVLELASGRETVSGRELHLREGVVIRPAVERYSPVVGGRAIAKAVSPAYLTRKGGTEYE
ncbi:RNA ligase (ATP) [Streptomyces sp. NPDC002889]|uniref:RNA ligase (ATP) n=1 Tax=Streptomyces sp. NPDC002889 TaxID=3364669 RepID=UPI003676C5F8